MITCNQTLGDALVHAALPQAGYIHLNDDYRWEAKHTGLYHTLTHMRRYIGHHIVIIAVVDVIL